MLFRSRGVLFHTDACQSFTRVDLDVRAQPVDLVSLNAHKIYGPKGVGALYVRRGVRLEPLLHGGGHEHGLRSGTLNTTAIVGFARAVEITSRAEASAQAALRDALVERLLESLDGASLNGPRHDRLCNHVSLTLARGEARLLLLALSRQGIYVSAG